MKNKEKYSKEIVDIACNGDSIAVVRSTGELGPCCETSCRECIFYDDANPYCRDRIRAWANSEYIERPVISKSDKAFLEYLREEYEFVARDENGALYVYETQPRKVSTCWISAGLSPERYSYLNQHFNIDFPMIKWSDEKPWMIEDLKKLEVVEEY